MANASVRATLRIPSEQVREPIFYRLISTYGLVPNIYSANIDIPAGGTLVLDFSGDPARLREALAWLRANGVAVELDGEEQGTP